MMKFETGQEIKTTIAAITDTTVFLDLNSKTEGILNKDELKDENGNCIVKVNDKIKAFFLYEKDGELIFTTKITGENADLTMLENAFEKNIIVEGRVEKEIKGGFEIKIGSIKAFCPYSQMGFKQKEKPSFYIGKILNFFIKQYENNGKTIILSNKAVLEENHKEKLAVLSKELTEGKIAEGTVTAIHNWGAFVDIKGFQALLPVSEISFERINDIQDILSKGQKIKAKIIKTDWNNERISISTKALIKDPWETISSEYEIGKKIEGKIARIQDYGIFVELKPGIDGLIHISTLENISYKTNLKKIYKIGNKISVVIKEIDVEKKRISLLPSSSQEQDNSASEYLKNQNESLTYNPFAFLLKK